MHKKSFTFVVVLCLYVIALVGCRKEQRPDGMPPLVPCEISVTQDGNPLDGATVGLVAEKDASGKVWLVNGHTGPNGVAVIKTYGRFTGAPINKYKVTVFKEETEKVGPVYIDKDTGREKQETHYYHLVEPALAMADTSTLELEVVKGTKRYTVDVGKAVRVEIQMP